ncbi:MAG: hypothetical protein P1U56_17100 [Saprospiraceae bacterium]|nr:hypothetical protein [Saprospiraceae bacterium]
MDLESVTCKIYTKYPEQNWIKATDTEFIQEATAIIKAFDYWIPDKIDGQYINSERYFPICFYYHERTLNDPTIILNPDVRPKCLDTSWKYNKYVHSENGHDGAGTILAIINEDGYPESIESYHILGKTNKRIVEGNFKQLGQWKPAIHDGVPVKSQVSRYIYT